METGTEMSDGMRRNDVFISEPAFDRMRRPATWPCPVSGEDS